MLDSAILAALASGDHGRMVVVERASPIPVGESVLHADFARVTHNPFRVLGGPERVAWLLWCWVAWWMVCAIRARHKQRGGGFLGRTEERGTRAGTMAEFLDRVARVVVHRRAGSGRAGQATRELD